MSAIKLYEKMAEPVFLAWVLTLILIWLLFRTGRNLIETVLMKLYEVLIQQNLMKL